MLRDIVSNTLVCQDKMHNKFLKKEYRYFMSYNWIHEVLNSLAKLMGQWESYNCFK